MNILINILIGFIAFFHYYILWFEMFAWETKGPKIFTNFPKDLFPKTIGLAANLGVYNGFLATGLTWTFFIENSYWSQNIALFFLSCVSIAGIYGAKTSKKIFFTQALPALICLGLILFTRL